MITNTLQSRWLIVGAVVLVCTTAVGVGVVAGLDAQGRPNITPYIEDNEVTPGSQTTVTVVLANDGTLIDGVDSDREVVTTARSVVVDASAPNSPITVDTSTRTVGNVAESDTTSVGFNITVPDRIEPGRYDFSIETDYSYTYKARTTGSKTINEERTESTTEQLSLRVTPDARFKIIEDDSTLRVGEEGKITGELENIGQRDATNAEVTFAPNSETVVALESNVAVGDVPAGESTQFSIPVEVTSDAEAVPKRFDLPVTFRDHNGIRQSDDDPDFAVNVAEQRDAFLIEPQDSSIEAGSSDTLDIELTNNRDERVTDIEGKLFADDPLSSENDETYTEALDPGETTTVTVDLSAGGDATIKTYPVSMDFRYTDSDGDSKLSDSYRTAITVTEPTDDSGGLPIGPLLLGLLAVAGAGAFLWRRNDGSVDDLGGFRDE